MQSATRLAQSLMRACVTATRRGHDLGGRPQPATGGRSRARWCAPSRPTRATTCAGRRRGSSRRCSRRARPPATSTLGAALRRARHPVGVVGGRPRQLRRGRAGDASPRRAARARQGRRPTAQARLRAACATSSSACSCCSSCTDAATSCCTARPPSMPWRRSPPGATSGREDASALSASYAFLRTLEHRIQVHRLRRTHVIPDAEDDLRRIARSMGMRTDPVAELTAALRRHRQEVRRLHEKLFYRPLLNAVARLDAGRGAADARGRPPAARGARLHRPCGRAAPPRGAVLRRHPACRDPAHAAAGDARLVRDRARTPTPGCSRSGG